MKYLLILPLLILFSVTLYADSVYVTPSLYYTRGDYTNESLSDSYAAYLSIGNNKQRLIFSFDQLIINNPEWKYEQRYFNAGGIFGFTDFYLKLNYGHVSGTEDLLDYHNDIYNLDAFYTNYFSFIGGSYTFHKKGGFETKEIAQVMLRLEHIPHWRVLLSVKPTYTRVSDGRELFGTSLRFHYLPFDYFLFKLHGFIGERAYFFDPDLLVLYNQDETQKYLAAAQLEYFLSLNFSLIGGFQHTSFGSYKINYYILGIRTNFIVD
jgi:hypothetical protein